MPAMRRFPYNWFRNRLLGRHALVFVFSFMFRSRLDDRIEIMDAQRYDRSKGILAKACLRIQTGKVMPSLRRKWSSICSSSPAVSSNLAREVSSGIKTSSVHAPSRFDSSKRADGISPDVQPSAIRPPQIPVDPNMPASSLVDRDSSGTQKDLEFSSEVSTIILANEVPSFDTPLSPLFPSSPLVPPNTPAPVVDGFSSGTPSSKVESQSTTSTVAIPFNQKGDRFPSSPLSQTFDLDDDFHPGEMRQVDVFDRGDYVTTRTIIRRVGSRSSLLSCGLSRPSSPLSGISNTLGGLLSKSRYSSPSPPTSRPSSPTRHARPSSPFTLNLNLSLASLGCMSLSTGNPVSGYHSDVIIDGMLEREAAQQVPNIEVLVSQTTESRREELWREAVQKYHYGPEFMESVRKRRANAPEPTFGFGIS